MAFSEVSGLDKNYDPITYKECREESDTATPYPRLMYMPGQLQPINISLKKGLVVKKSVPVLWDWFNSIRLNRVEKKDITISLCDEAGTPLVEWLAKKALGVVTGLVGGFAGSALNKLAGLLFEEYKFTMSQWMADPKKRDIKVHLIDYSGEAVVTWTLVDALPIKLDAPSLDAEQNAIAIEAIEVVGSELRMEYSKPSQSFF